MEKYVTNREAWLKEYRKDKESIWVRVILSDGLEIFFKDFKTWLSLRDKCKNDSLSVCMVKLQYRSHVVDIDTADSEAVYLVRAIMGEIGGNSRNYYTVGTLKDNIVYKTRWLVPELVEEEKVEETLDNCFEEAIIYNHARKTNG
jgi:hypothetical protein